jgi:hypothetical protein
MDEVLNTNLAGEYAGIRTVANLFESMGLFVRIGMMDRQIAFPNSRIAQKAPTKPM